MAVWVVSLSDANLIARALTPGVPVSGIRSLSGVGTLVGALAQTVLYLRYIYPEANPKVISERTSYLLV
jgi:hypothetical protein